MSRDYRGTTYHAHLSFQWPSGSRLAGQPGKVETASSTYEDVERWLLEVGFGFPYRVSDGERDCDVFPNEALIVPDHAGCVAVRDMATSGRHAHGCADGGTSPEHERKIPQITPGAEPERYGPLPPLTGTELAVVESIATELASRFVDSDDPAASAVAIIELARRSLPAAAIPTREDLEIATASVAGLPTILVSSSRLAALRSLSGRLAGRIIGQSHAIEVMSGSILRRTVALGERRRPIGVYLLVGPTGVGKTELARAVAIEHFGSERDLVRFDMGQYKEQHEALKLTGAPPSYAGHESGGQLFNAFGEDRQGPWLQTRRGAVLLLDEFEKANPSIHDLFLSAFDYGFITGSKGESLDLRYSIVVMTSNIGVREANEATSRNGLGFGTEMGRDRAAEAAAVRSKAVRDRFAPEFLNRLDAIVEFSALSRDDLERILDLRISDYARVLASAGMTLTVGPRLRSEMIDEALASGMGARDLCLRQFSARVEDPVTTAVAGDLYQRGATFEIELCSGTATLVRSLPAQRLATAA